MSTEKGPQQRRGKKKTKSKKPNNKKTLHTTTQLPAISSSKSYYLKGKRENGGRQTIFLLLQSSAAWMLCFQTQTLKWLNYFVSSTLRTCTIGIYLPVLSYTSWKISFYKSGRNSQLSSSTSKLPLKPLAPAEASTTCPLKEMLLHDKSINAF